ncbi:MAG: hypothetical protein R3223_09950 [Longimicrobiales bacterium]|nr:hypothetical protein [Longimicrobiales bacterium]
MSSPLRPPDDDWWSIPVHGQEKAWLWLVAVTCVILFGWMTGWMFVGEQNPTGPTYRTSPEDFQAKVAAYLEESEQTDRGTVPAGTDIFVGGVQFAWDGFPVILEAGTEYQLHLSSYDVQHGFSIRLEDELWKQINLQAVPGYEWIVPMEFEEPGTYHVVCNEFCGIGHRLMYARFEVVPPGGTDVDSDEAAEDADDVDSDDTDAGDDADDDDEVTDAA